MPRRLAQQRTTSIDLEWQFHESHAISVVAELLLLIDSIMCLFSGNWFVVCRVNGSLFLTLCYVSLNSRGSIATTFPVAPGFTLCLKKWDTHSVPHSSHKNRALWIKFGTVNRKSWDRPPTFLRQIYRPPFGKVSLSSVCWCLSAKPGNEVECRIYEGWIKTRVQLFRLWTKVHVVSRRYRKPLVVDNAYARLCISPFLPKI